MKTNTNLSDADGFYEQLMDAHAGMGAEQSELLNARLILLLANQVGDARVQMHPAIVLLAGITLRIIIRRLSVLGRVVHSYLHRWCCNCRW